MSVHKNARTTPHGRAVMVQPSRSANGATVRKWMARYRLEGPAGLQDRLSRARTVANRLAQAWIGMALRLRRDYRLTAAEIASNLKLACSTGAGHLVGAGLGWGYGGSWVTTV